MRLFGGRKLDISKEIQDKIIDLFINTKLHIPEILQIVNLDEKISLENIYDFLYEYRNEEGKMIKKNRTYFGSMMDEKIYQLKKEGKDSEEISRVLFEDGYRVTVDFVEHRCESIFRSKNEKSAQFNLHRKNTIKISEKDIFDKVQKGESISKITEEYNQNGIKVSYYTVISRYKAYCRSIGVNEKINKSKVVKKTKKDKKVERKLDGREELIYRLRKNGYPYTAIREYLNQQGIDVSPETVRRECKRIFEQKGEFEPKYIRLANDKYKEYYNIVYDMRKQGYSYYKIADHLNKLNVDITDKNVETICKIVFQKYGEEEPKTKSDTSRRVSNQRVYELRKARYSCKKIVQILNDEGIQVSYGYLVDLCRKIFKEKGEKMPPVRKYRRTNTEIAKVKNKKVLIDAMLKVAEKRKATQEQLRIFAKEISKYYEEDINFDLQEKNSIEETELDK